MGAQPKRRSSKSVVNKRRIDDALHRPQLVRDPNTKKLVLPHRVNLETGIYKKRKVFEVK